MKRHLAANDAEICTNLAVEWKFTDKFRDIVADGACNVVAAIAKTPFHHITCVAL